MNEPRGMPLVSVVMPVLNAGPSLRAAVESILTQKYGNMELIAVNDGSMDDSAFKLEAFNDPRIRIIANPKNMGVSASLNAGMKAALGKYIARMDADDISLPGRIRDQVSFLEANPDVDIVGAWTITEHDGRHYMNRYYADHESITASLFFQTSLSHPSVMMRKSSAEKHGIGYDTSFVCAQDYDLWTRYCRKLRFANIPKVLLIRKVGGPTLTEKQSERTAAERAAIVSRMFSSIGLSVPTDLIPLRPEMSDKESALDFLQRQRAWLKRVLEANEKREHVRKDILEKIISERWDQLCSASWRHGLPVWRSWRKTPNDISSRRLNAYLLAKCVIGLLRSFARDARRTSREIFGF